MRHAGLFVAASLVTACADGSKPTSPSTPAAGTMSLAGNWSGTMSESSADPDPDRLSWTAAQTGASLSGTAILTMTGETPKVVNGTMTGAVTGSQVSLTFTLPAGSLVQFGVPAGCSVAGTATATPTATSISATMTRTFSSACIGVIVSSATDTVQLSLTKQ